MEKSPIEQRLQERKERYVQLRNERTRFLVNRKEIDEATFQARQSSVSTSIMDAISSSLVSPLVAISVAYVPYDRWLRKLSPDETVCLENELARGPTDDAREPLPGFSTSLWFKWFQCSNKNEFKHVQNWEMVCATERYVPTPWRALHRPVPRCNPATSTPAHLGLLHSVMVCDEPNYEDHPHDFGGPANVLVTLRGNVQIPASDQKTENSSSLFIHRVVFPTDRPCREQRPYWCERRQIVHMLESSVQPSPHFEFRSSLSFGVNAHTHEIVDCVVWHASSGDILTTWWQDGFVHTILDPVLVPYSYTSGDGDVRPCGGDEDVSGPGIYFTDSCRPPRLLLRGPLGYNERSVTPVDYLRDILYYGGCLTGIPLIGYKLEWLFGNGLDYGE